MVTEGGKRDRMVSHSLFRLVQDKLDELNWLDETPAEHQRVRVIEGPWPDETPIPLNTVIVYIDDIDYDEMEVGSSNSEFSSKALVADVYAESQSIGTHLAGDVCALLRGQMPSIDRTQAKLEVYDWSLATPAVFAVCDLVDISNLRGGKGSTQPWERYWWSVTGTIEDEVWVGL